MKRILVTAAAVLATAAWAGDARSMVAAEQFRDTPLATLLKKELPTLENHRKMTLDLLQKEKPSATALRRAK